MGYAIAKIARRRGAEVILITGQTHLPQPRNDIEVVEVVTACEMRDAVMEHYRACTVIIKAAAVADFKCSTENCNKIKKKGDESTMLLELTKNPDIIGELGMLKENRILVGFAAETENLLENASEKLKKKNLDLIIANDVSKSDIGFGSDNNEVIIIEVSGKTRHVPIMSKEEIANIIFDSIKKIIKKRKVVKDDWY
jgi:phosphopantothenoylcysteine decarboxylase/phosphopantothenate--cysteine ligase